MQRSGHLTFFSSLKSHSNAFEVDGFHAHPLLPIECLRGLAAERLSNEPGWQSSEVVDVGLASSPISAFLEASKRGKEREHAVGDTDSICRNVGRLCCRSRTPDSF